MLLQLPSQKKHGVILVSILVFCLIFSFFLFRSPRHVSTSYPPKPSPPPPAAEFYNWDTQSSFHPTQVNTTGRSIEDICSAFPSHLLDSIQPVLRTGHGLLEKRIQPQLTSTLACLSNLLIFSDVSETFEGHNLIDVIADTSSFNHTAIETHEQLAPYRNLHAAIASNSAKDILEASQAWDIDKFKFLPSISRAWRMAPERRWYVFFEGDTFVLWDNLFRLLENFDPDVPLYFGNPAGGMAGTFFAHGGEGYVISREAMRRLTKNDFDSKTGEYLGPMLAKEYWQEILGDCCGDSILGWTLWNNQVPLSGLFPMFNNHPPHGVPFSDKFWCQPVISMHKPHEHDMENLWHWEHGQRQLQRPLLYRDLALSYLEMTQLTTRYNWDNADFDGYLAPDNAGYGSMEACAAACEVHDECFQWTYRLRQCSFVRSFRLGFARDLLEPEDAEEASKYTDEEKRFISGWQTAKIQKWIDERPCEKPLWLVPSTERRF